MPDKGRMKGNLSDILLDISERGVTSLFIIMPKKFLNGWKLHHITL